MTDKTKRVERLIGAKPWRQKPPEPLPKPKKGQVPKKGK